MLLKGKRIAIIPIGNHLSDIVIFEPIKETIESLITWAPRHFTCIELEDSTGKFESIKARTLIEVQIDGDLAIASISDA